MNYNKINFSKVKGYNKLSDKSKRLFEEIYKRHNSMQGNEYKEDYIPVEIVEQEEKFKVIFKNKEWLYYYFNGTWG